MSEEVPLVPLFQLREGEEGTVKSLLGGKHFSSRLAALGIALNMGVKMLRNHGGMVIVQAGDTRVALGAGEAGKVLVQLKDVGQCGEVETRTEKILVALAGQPNVGKSTVFNILTGLSQHVGNWPGKTVEKKEGTYLCGEVEMRIVDLPGTYSLTSFSEEERIARDFILREKPDVVVLIASAAALERGLYLLSELLLLGPPVIVAVNMLDVAEAQNIYVDLDALQNALGIPVVGMVANKNRGINELVSQIIATARKDITYLPRHPRVAAHHRHVFQEIYSLLEDYLDYGPPNDAGYKRFLAVKLMEGDGEISSLVEKNLPTEVWEKIRGLLVAHEDSLHAVVGGRYEWIGNVTRAAVSRHKMGQVLLTDRIDKFLTRPLFGIPALVGVFVLVFIVTYGLGAPMQKGMESVMSFLGQKIYDFLGSLPEWVRGLVVDGIMSGVGMVLTFIPILLIFFVVLAILEDVGYMARVAFVMDRLMHVIGLHGKSVLPICLGFGCNVPAVMGTRIIESVKERLITIFLTPFVPCTARLTVLTFVTAAVFPTHAWLVASGLFTLNMVLLGVTGMVAKKIISRDEVTPFIMELPLYHKPDVKTISMVVWNRLISFVKKAGTIILAVSIVIWALSYWPTGRIEESYLAFLGRIIEPLGKPLGFDWRIMMALVTSIIAKENAVATLAVLYNVGREGLIQTLSTYIPPASALSFLAVLLLFIPCVATVAVMKQEFKSRRWFLSSLLFMLFVSYSIGFLVYNVSRAFGLS
ncbi:MAG: ferrous iron transport protein B [Syntrophales bacterium]|nr:ferrous iron transport protein B [Syntrophales bacterium]